VWGYYLDPATDFREISADEAAEWLAAGGHAGSRAFVWLHFALTNATAESWMRSRLQLPDGFYSALRDTIGSTRLEQDNEELVAVFHDVLFDFHFDAADISTVAFSLGPRHLVSARMRPLRSVDRLRAAVRSGRRFRSPGELLAELMFDQARVLVDVVRRSTEQVDETEDMMLRERVTRNRSELSALRRLLVRIQRLLAPEPAALFRLLNRPPRWLDEEDLRDLRQAAEELSTAATDSAALAERIKILQEELVALTSERTNRILFLLTLVTVLALPVNLVAALLGMNVGGIPFADSQYGFAVVIVLLAGLTSILAYFTMRLRGD
jgi:zinc transporter